MAMRPTERIPAETTSPVVSLLAMRSLASLASLSSVCGMETKGLRAISHSLWRTLTWSPQLSMGLAISSCWATALADPITPSSVVSEMQARTQGSRPLPWRSTCFVSSTASSSSRLSLPKAKTARSHDWRSLGSNTIPPFPCWESPPLLLFAWLASLSSTTIWRKTKVFSTPCTSTPCTVICWSAVMVDLVRTVSESCTCLLVAKTKQLRVLLVSMEWSALAFWLKTFDLIPLLISFFLLLLT
mmetsp:Transcript_11696/g.32404  ORF Transcript_11696/g.32404 Transcript_11696/m.32404 type:complete len:243 (-) Transcript_11696:1310-2038(-)